METTQNARPAVLAALDRGVETGELAAAKRRNEAQRCRQLSGFRMPEETVSPQCPPDRYIRLQFHRFYRGQMG